MAESTQQTLDLRNEDLVEGLEARGFFDISFEHTFDTLGLTNEDWNRQRYSWDTYAATVANAHDSLRLTAKDSDGDVSLRAVSLVDGRIIRLHDLDSTLIRPTADTTPHEVDALIAARMLMRGTNDAVMAARQRACTFTLKELAGARIDPTELAIMRLSQEMRMAYGNGRAREAFAIAHRIPELGAMPFEPDSVERADAVVVDLNSEAWACYPMLRGQEAKTFQLRAVEQALGEAALTELEGRRLGLLRDELARGLQIDLFTPEVTYEDVLEFPNDLNPHPELGTPVVFGGELGVDAGASTYEQGVAYRSATVVGLVPGVRIAVTRPDAPSVRAGRESRLRMYAADDRALEGIEFDPDMRWLYDRARYFAIAELLTPAASEVQRVYTSMMKGVVHDRTGSLPRDNRNESRSAALLAEMIMATVALSRTDARMAAAVVRFMTEGPLTARDAIHERLGVSDDNAFAHVVRTADLWGSAWSIVAPVSLVEVLDKTARYELARSLPDHPELNAVDTFLLDADAYEQPNVGAAAARSLRLLQEAFPEQFSSREVQFTSPRFESRRFSPPSR